MLNVSRSNGTLQKVSSKPTAITQQDNRTPVVMEMAWSRGSHYNRIVGWVRSAYKMSGTAWRGSWHHIISEMRKIAAAEYCGQIRKLNASRSPSAVSTPYPYCLRTIPEADWADHPSAHPAIPEPRFRTRSWSQSD